MNQKINCYLDTEWASDGSPISLQALFEYDSMSRTYCVVHTQYCENLERIGVIDDMTIIMIITTFFYYLIPY